ncbi:ecdysteroid 22-kinase family protein [Stieleria sp. TO1_6]|uniref:ecdysteroid 22-kinase family protein n=1 Tax=Stieleria tagensis TaxID=2956795 RepID=UPI00209A70E4|nr:ecdysteroid 22-kinase family protein [Stieleria tagensis]MCO8124231.1 ecdysteroid 22-kinase family protein [Stieleria tagensis]
MEDRQLKSLVCDIMQAERVTETESIQSLWSGYGQILRMGLKGSAVASSVIVKQIAPVDVGIRNARGWSGQVSHDRKRRSYQIEMNWYQTWSQCCGLGCRVPHCYRTESVDGHQLFVLEDLDASGYGRRLSRVNDRQLAACLKWLANFHGLFLNQTPGGLWPTGTYWHLQTRPEEFAVMADGPLKQAAPAIDQRLSDCRFKTIVHGDAKVANFCFGDHWDGSAGDQVAAVDFQYVGGGCGIKDVAYFLGSCLSDDECQRREQECLGIYFDQLRRCVDPMIATDLEQEWRTLFPWAWADFHRFLCGWCATHPKLTAYSGQMVDQVIAELAATD